VLQKQFYTKLAMFVNTLASLSKTQILEITTVQKPLYKLRRKLAISHEFFLDLHEHAKTSAYTRITERSISGSMG
jgi:hypothetical protein